MSLFDFFYGTLLFVFSPLLVIKQLFNRQFRADFRARLNPGLFVPEQMTADSSSRIWVHAASIGEIRLAIKVVHAWLAIDSKKSFFITTNTLQSRTLGQKETEVPVLVAPFDFSKVVKRFINLTNPRHLVLIETEIWPNMIRLMSERGSISVVNGRLSDRYFKRYMTGRRLLSKTIASLDWILARDQISVERFKMLGVPADKTLYQGNLKFEIPETPSPESLDLIKSEYRAVVENPLLVAGSVQPEELSQLLQAWKELEVAIPEIQMVLIPRHPDKKEEFSRILSQHNIRYSLASDKSNNSTNDATIRIHIVDQMGVLKSWYYLADVIFVGGSLCDRGGQNMVEAVGYQKPVCIGPFATNFKDEVDLLVQVNGLKIIHNASDLVEFILFSHRQSEQALQMGKRGYHAISEQAHALEANIKKLTEIYS